MRGYAIFQVLRAHEQISLKTLESAELENQELGTQAKAVRV